MADAHQAAMIRLARLDNSPIGGDAALAQLAQTDPQAYNQLAARAAQMVGGGGGQVSPEAVRRSRAMTQAQADIGRRNAAADAAVPRNPWDVFGTGQGNWAQAWSQATAPRQGLFDMLAGNQIGGFLNYGNALDQQYNSPMGPYGKLQFAATAQRPYKAQENVAQIQADADKYIADTNNRTKMGLADMFGDSMRGFLSPTSITTDYGAAVTPQFRHLRSYRGA